ncbi:hypothetical protein NK553_19320 [Pseudomonas sp. ZM23]|uniref:Type III secretion system protein n=1 Tax=Pseudomonas triclosanedens TaxID=2961893 RepID=A0ABY6ZTQ4_9PSED|nr:hypothetical protein [Pseudomonas triclosanedens]MCP8466107.1 hypothetical protein [Pseudomonas triclosanedens]MCP8472342.1 hypothetical protein [Pseudomonas triclosanedens]MCP8477406.1 hypothetical protein [Pseudomonas triclosanedens]WAI47259.1 hypothetical protein OU419_15895 [Pseudomonas triclosanedens]
MTLPARVAPLAEEATACCRPLPAAQAVDARYQVTTETDADVLCRMLNLFALQGQIPTEVLAQRQNDGLRIHLRLTSLPRHRVELIAERMRSMVNVCSVELQVSERHTVRSAT